MPSPALIDTVVRVRSISEYGADLVRLHASVVGGEGVHDLTVPLADHPRVGDHLHIQIEATEAPTTPEE